MKYKVKDLNKCTKQYTIEVDRDMIVAEYEKYYVDVQKEAVIPGFRKGKAPRGMIENYYKKEAKEHVVRELVSQAYSQTVKESGVRPFGLPDIADLAFDETKLSFTATVELRPEFELKRYKGIKTKKNIITVETAEIDTVLERLRTSCATYRVVENRPVAINDYIVADTKCEIDGKVVDDQKAHALEVNEQHLLPAYVQNLIGMNINDQKVFSVTFPENIPQKEYQKKMGTFTVILKEIKEKVLPEIDEKFLKIVGDYEKIDDLHEAIRKDLQRQKDMDEDARIERELLDAICKETSFDMPQSLIDDRREKLIDEVKHTMQRQGMPEADIEEQKDRIHTDCEAEARRQVHVAFILDKVVQLENITVSEEDVSAKLYELSRRYRQTVDAIRAHYEKEDLMDSLRSEIRNEKAIELIKKEAIYS